MKEGMAIGQEDSPEASLEGRGEIIEYHYLLLLLVLLLWREREESGRLLIYGIGDSPRSGREQGLDECPTVPIDIVEAVGDLHFFALQSGGFFVGCPLCQVGAEAVDDLLEVVAGGLMLLKEGEGLGVCLCVCVCVVALVINDQGRTTTHV